MEPRSTRARARLLTLSDAIRTAQVFGILSLAWLAAQFALGAASVWFGGAALGGGPRAKRVWKYHRRVPPPPSLHSALTLTHALTRTLTRPVRRLSGYVLLPLVLTTANFGGAWSAWVTGSSAHGVRIVAYTLAPAVILLSLYSRVRCVLRCAAATPRAPALTPAYPFCRPSKMRFF